MPLQPSCRRWPIRYSSRYGTSTTAGSARRSITAGDPAGRELVIRATGKRGPGRTGGTPELVGSARVGQAVGGGPHFHDRGGSPASPRGAVARRRSGDGPRGSGR